MSPKARYVTQSGIWDIQFITRPKVSDCEKWAKKFLRKERSVVKQTTQLNAKFAEF
jgi:transcriptional regulator